MTKRCIVLQKGVVTNENIGNNPLLVSKRDYRYVIGNKRIAIELYTIQKFKDDNTLTWVSGLSAEELAKYNDIDRIWDAGRTSWVKYLSG